MKKSNTSLTKPANSNLTRNSQNKSAVISSSSAHGQSWTPERQTFLKTSVHQPTLSIGHAH